MSKRRFRKQKLPSEPVELEITSLSHEGRGIAHIDGKVAFSEASAKFRGRLKDYAKKHKSDTERTKMVNIAKVVEKYNITEEKTKIICRYTGDVLDWKKPEECEIDHEYPRSKGGENTIENLQILSKLANQAKGDMTHDEFIDFIKKCYHHCC